MNRHVRAAFLLVVLAAFAGCARFAAEEPAAVPEPEIKTTAAKTLLQEKRYPEAIVAFRGIQQEYAGTDWAARANYGVAMIFVASDNAQRDYTLALQEIEEFLSRYPAHEKAEDARSWRQALKTLLDAKKENERLKKNIEQLKQLDLRQEEKRTRRK